MPSLSPIKFQGRALKRRVHKIKEYQSDFIKRGLREFPKGQLVRWTKPDGGQIVGVVRRWVSWDHLEISYGSHIIQCHLAKGLLEKESSNEPGEVR